MTKNTVSPPPPPRTTEIKDLFDFMHRVMAQGKIQSYRVNRQGSINDAPYFRLEIEGIFDPNL
jgi:hypothetical protein